MKINRTKLLQIGGAAMVVSMVMLDGAYLPDVVCQGSTWLMKFSMICLAIWFCTGETKEQ
jgi:hypothetical protein